MRFRTVEELVALGLLEPKPPDPARVARWLKRSRTDQALAADVLARLDRDRAMAVAYEAGYRACAGLLVLAGYRVTSQPGHHRGGDRGRGSAPRSVGPTAPSAARRGPALSERDPLRRRPAGARGRAASAPRGRGSPA